MKTILLLCVLLTVQVQASVQFYNSSDANLGNFAKAKCNTNLTCSQTSGKLVISLKTAAVPSDSGGFAVSSGQLTRYLSWPPPTLTSGTSTTPSATTVYLSQIYVRSNATLTGIAVSNGATVGTNKYVVALFNSAGTALATSALAGALTSGADAWQTVDFTATYAAVGPSVYWIGLYVDGVTDRFRSIPAVGAFAGLAGSVTGQTFGTVVAVTLPTTFTADKGPVAYVY